MKNRRTPETYIPLLSIIFITIILPSTLFCAGYRYFSSTLFRHEKSAFLGKAEILSRQLTDFVDNDQFWAIKLNKVFEKAHDIASFEKDLNKLAKGFNQKIGFVIWTKNFKSYATNIFDDRNEEKWLEAVIIIQKKLDNLGYKPTEIEDIFLRRLIGPHFQLELLKDSFKQLPRLIESDFCQKHPLIWGNSNKTVYALVFLPPAIRKKAQGIKLFCKSTLENLSKEFSYRISSKDYYFSNNKKFMQAVALPLQPTIGDYSPLTVVNDQLVYVNDISAQCRFVLIKKSHNLQTYRFEGLFIVFLIFFAVIFIRHFSMAKLLTSLELKKAISVLILFSNLLPLMLLSFFAYHYLAQKRLVLIEEKRSDSIRFIQLIENEFMNEIARFPGKVREKLEVIENELKKSKLNVKVGQKLIDSIYKSNLDFYLMASDSEIICSHQGLIKNGRFYHLRGHSLTKGKQRLEKLLAKLGACYIAIWNKENIDQKLLTEIELITDALFKKPVEETLHLFIEINNRLGSFGFGRISLPSFTDLMFINEPDKADYFGIYQFDIGRNSRQFLRDNKRERLANPYGIKVIFQRNNQFITNNFLPFTDSIQIRKIFIEATNTPPISPQIKKIEGEEYISSCFHSSVFEDLILLALFPLNEIDEKLREEKNDILILIVLNLLMVLGISYFFTQTFLAPVSWLEHGTKAIDARNFSFRLPDLGKDEMGRMALIFNETLEDLQQLNVAGLIQQQLLPENEIDTGNYSMFGRSIPMNDLGGDFMDYFEIDENHFALMLGDVAGHGVGAAMLMAMAKSTILNSEELYLEPAQIMARLHQIIYNAKSRKQKKIMTFQYLLINKFSNKILFSNAGGCNPFVIRKNEVEEIKLPAAALGSFKKGKFSEMFVEFEPGDVIVLYTDGIVEARNSAGNEIGYEKFKKMLLENYSDDSKQFYNSMFLQYRSWLKGVEPQDDFSMVFLGLPAKKKING
jgi:HAMP domain-containing protein